MKKAQTNLLATLLTLFILFLPVQAATTTGVPTSTAEPTTTTQTTQAADSIKTYTITQNEDAGVILADPTTPAFWEYAELPAGQQRQGRFTIRNNSSEALSVRLLAIDLPYEDEQALTYFASLHIRVTSGGSVLYDGPYTGIGGLKLEINSLAPGESKDYTVSMHCAFSYEGNPSEVTSRAVWTFQASRVVKQSGSRSTPEKLMGFAALIVAGATVIALFVVSLVRKSRKQP